MYFLFSKLKKRKSFRFNQRHRRSVSVEPSISGPRLKMKTKNFLKAIFVIVDV